MTDQELYDDIYRRCMILCDKAATDRVTLGDVSIERAGPRITVCILGERRKAGPDYWVSSSTVYDSNAPAAEQVTSTLIEHVIPVMQRWMVLDDLSDV